MESVDMNEHTNPEEDEDVDEAPRFSEIALVEAEIAIAAGDMSRAREHLQKAMQFGSALDSARARVELACLEANVGEYEVAEGLLLEAEQFGMTTLAHEFLLDLAAAWRLVGKSASAARMYQRVLDGIGLSPRDELSAIPTATGTKLSAHDRFVAAFACLQLAMLADDRALGIDGAALYEAALAQADPDVSPFAAIALAWLESRKRPARQEWLLRDAIEYDHPEASPHAAFELARMLARRERYDDAERHLSAIRTSSGHPRWAREADAVLRQGVRNTDWAWAGMSDLARGRASSLPRSEQPHAHKVIIVGAGTGGQYLFESLQLDRSQRRRHEVIGFIDDHPYPGGVPNAPDRPVLGTIGQLRDVLGNPKTRPDQVWLAMPTVVPAVKREVVLACIDECVPVQTLPTMHELIPENRLVAQLRNPRVEDLVGERWEAGDDPRGERAITVDRTAATWLRSRRVLIVGAGTMGTQLARKAADAGAERVVVVDQSASSRERLEDELRARGFDAVYTHHAMSTDGDRLLGYASDHQCDTIFYTARGWPDAHSDPIRRRQVIHGIKALVDGLADVTRIERFVWVSDANVAVANNPKRAMQAITEAIAVGPLEGRDSAVRCAIRMPATFTSTASIIRRFHRLARLGAPLRVPPGPDARRFVHAYVAAELILHAARISQPCEVLELDCGADVSVRWLAELVLRLHGLTPGEDVAVIEDPALTVADAPRPTGTQTEVSRVLSLGRPHESPRLGQRIQRLLEDDAADVVGFAQQFCAHLHGTPAHGQGVSPAAAVPRSAPVR
jgi:FlaA1/EpsC-like NDP-sugar epimerase